MNINLPKLAFCFRTVSIMAGWLQPQRTLLSSPSLAPGVGIAPEFGLFWALLAAGGGINCLCWFGWGCLGWFWFTLFWAWIFVFWHQFCRAGNTSTLLFRVILERVELLLDLVELLAFVELLLVTVLCDLFSGTALTLDMLIFMSSRNVVSHPPIQHM